METLYLFTSSGGDVPVDPETLKRPFFIRPFVNHPFMTLEDYFQAVRDFTLQKGGETLARVLSRSWGREVAADEPDRLLIRYEKYGTLYQMASVEVFCGGDRLKLAASAALSPEAKAVLAREFELLSRLGLERGLPYLPEAYFKGPVSVKRQGRVQAILMALFRWFEGYHEWHFSRDEAGRERIFIWDTDRGYGFLSGEEAFRVIREASKILTLYYDMETYRRIFPWHHGAGDFVLRRVEGEIDVKLITARGYEPLRFPGDREAINPLKGILYFLLELSVKMRLDRREGLAEIIWAEAPIVQAVIEGFVDALRIREAKGDCPAGRVDDVVKGLKAMGERDLRERLSAYMDLHEWEDGAESAVLRSHLDEHAGEVALALREFTG